MERSGLCSSTELQTSAPMTPAEAPNIVVTRTKEILVGSAERMEPPLNPNQPSHRQNTPIVASGMLCPMIGIALPFTYLPIRGPSSSTPASAPQPPTLWTKVEPAKSWKFRSASQPPPQPQEPITG